MLIYKIFRNSEWQMLKTQKETIGAPIDIADGYIHFSTAAQAPQTARKYFSDMDGLILAAVNTDLLGDALKWEPSRGGDLFPHLYATLRLAHITWHAPLPWRDGSHHFPKEMI